MNLADLNAFSVDAARAEFLRCCGSLKWANAMVDKRPYNSVEDLFEWSGQVAGRLERNDWLEAFSHHPRIGDMESLRARFTITKDLSLAEQAGAADASEEVIQALARENDTYFNRFGYIFIVCATGKGAAEMLDILRSRLSNNPEQELLIAAGEQNRITQLRLEKLFS